MKSIRESKACSRPVSFRVPVEDDWLLVPSPASPEGRCGCAIGIAVKSALGQTGTKDVLSVTAPAMPSKRKPKKLAVTADHVHVLHADARILAITINLSRHVIVFASHHAPDTSKGAITNEWWCNACAVLRRFPRQSFANWQQSTIIEFSGERGEREV